MASEAVHEIEICQIFEFPRSPCVHVFARLEETLFAVIL